jgi:SAM-dependent methyltransferase
VPGYDEIAGWYDDAIREGALAPFHDWIVPITVDLAGGVEGYRVLDLACGQGVVARRLAERGASVLGVDVSEKLLDLARRYERDEPRGIEYERGDARTLDAVPDGAFDGVVCNMSLMDIPDLDATLGTVSRVLRPGGWFVFSVVHPVCQTPGSPLWAREGGTVVGVEIRDYFAEGYWRRGNPEGVRGKLGAHHRTLSTYVNGLARAGLFIERLLEPRATGEYADLAPVHRHVPVALVVRCAKRRMPRA